MGVPVSQDRRTRARLNVRPNVGPLAEAEIVRLVRAVESLFRSEVLVGPSTFRQDAMARVLVKDQSRKVAEIFLWSQSE